MNLSMTKDTKSKSYLLTESDISSNRVKLCPVFKLKHIDKRMTIMT